jgi:hypothetical protein
MNGEIVFLDLDARPCPTQQFVLADHGTFGIDQNQQNVDDPRANLYRGAIDQEPALAPP